MRTTKRLTAALCLGAVLLSGCGKKTAEPIVQTDDAALREVQALASCTDELTVWSAYWDCADDIDVLRQSSGQVQAVSLFAVSFEDGQLILPDATSRMLKKLSRGESTQDMQVYLSVVNDAVQDGKTTQKDTNILHTLLGTEQAARAHAQELVQTAKDNGCDGIEIDYEKIRSDMTLWQDFLRFEKLLLAEAQSAGLSVRVILEPSTPAEQLDFPDGAEYVVMCYNLYGSGTEPGPKADTAFLGELYERFAALPNLSFALANGGYDWEDGTQTAQSVTAAQAAALCNGTPERDADSGALHFTYKDGGKTHTVWYADETTLQTWTECLNKVSGGKVKISLWRL